MLDENSLDSSQAALEAIENRLRLGQAHRFHSSQAALETLDSRLRLGQALGKLIDCGDVAGRLEMHAVVRDRQAAQTSRMTQHQLRSRRFGSEGGYCQSEGEHGQATCTSTLPPSLHERAARGDSFTALAARPAVAVVSLLVLFTGTGTGTVPVCRLCDAEHQQPLASRAPASR